MTIPFVQFRQTSRRALVTPVKFARAPFLLVSVVVVRISRTTTGISSQERAAVRISLLTEPTSDALCRKRLPSSTIPNYRGPNPAQRAAIRPIRITE